ncbi:hypothetical protein GEMRC1_002001 [Eukaryota sp. GEM-RC1]
MILDLTDHKFSSILDKIDSDSPFDISSDGLSVIYVKESMIKLLNLPLYNESSYLNSVDSCTENGKYTQHQLDERIVAIFLPGHYFRGCLVMTEKFIYELEMSGVRRTLTSQTRGLKDIVTLCDSFIYITDYTVSVTDIQFHADLQREPKDRPRKLFTKLHVYKEGFVLVLSESSVDLTRTDGESNVIHRLESVYDFYPTSEKISLVDCIFIEAFELFLCITNDGTCIGISEKQKEISFCISTGIQEPCQLFFSHTSMTIGIVDVSGEVMTLCRSGGETTLEQIDFQSYCRSLDKSSHPNKLSPAEGPPIQLKGKKFNLVHCKFADISSILKGYYMVSSKQGSYPMKKLLYCLNLDKMY